MKSILCAILILVFSSQGFAKESESWAHDANDWESFDKAMEQVRGEDRKQGFSYLASGALVAVGGVAGASMAEDSTSKFVFGLSQSLGIAAMGYGVAKLSYGNSYNSFYESLRRSSLTPSQRDQLVKNFLAAEREKRETIRKINMATHALVGLVNLYAASKESDKNAKTFFQFFAGVNFALAVSYSF